MNKKLLTLAVAGALVAPVAAMADATLYGKIHLTIDYLDVEKNALFNEPADPDFNGWTLTSRSSRLGVKGSEDLGGDLKAIYQIEFNIPISNNSSDIDDGDTGSVKMRNSFVGLASNWGTLLAGRHDTPLKISTGELDLFNDSLVDYADSVGFIDERVDNTILYISPNFAGFQLAAASIPGGGATFGGGSNVDSDSLAEGYSLAAIYKNGPFYGSVAYEQKGQDVVDASAEDDNNYWRVGLGLLDWNGFTLAGIYEAQNNNGGVKDLDADLWQIQAGYSFGNSMVKAMYGANDQDSPFDLDDDELRIDFDDDINSWAIGFDHSLSKRTTAYALYAELTDDRADDADWSGFSVGMIHKF